MNAGRNLDDQIQHRDDLSAEQVAPLDHQQHARTLRALARLAGTDDGLEPLLGVLHRATGADVAVFDDRGNILAAVPARARWDVEVVLEHVGLAAQSAVRAPCAELVAVTVQIAHEPAAVLAARMSHDPSGAVQFAADLVAGQLARRQALLTGRRELTGQVLEDVVEGRLSERDAHTRLTASGIAVDQPFRVLIGQVDCPPGRLHQISWNLHSLLRDGDEPYVRATVDGRFVAVVPDHPVVGQLAATVLERLQRMGRDARIGVSAAHTGVLGLRIAWVEAGTAAAAGPGLNTPGSLDLGRVLVMSATGIDPADLAARVLRPLLKYDRRNNGDLVETLRAYLRSDRSSAPAAAALFVHRNTLRYRLRQIEELLDLSLDSTVALTNLWLALSALASQAPTEAGG